MIIIKNTEWYHSCHYAFIAASKSNNIGLYITGILELLLLLYLTHWGLVMLYDDIKLGENCFR